MSWRVLGSECVVSALSAIILAESFPITIVIMITAKWNHHLMHHLLCKLFFTETCLLWPFLELSFQRPGHSYSSPLRTSFKYLRSELPTTYRNRGGVARGPYLFKLCCLIQRKQELTLPGGEEIWSAGIHPSELRVNLDPWSLYQKLSKLEHVPQYLNIILLTEWYRGFCFFVCLLCFVSFFGHASQHAGS